MRSSRAFAFLNCEGWRDATALRYRGSEVWIRSMEEQNESHHTHSSNQNKQVKKTLIIQSVCTAGADATNYFLSANNESNFSMVRILDESDRMFEANNRCNYFLTIELTKELDQHILKFSLRAFFKSTVLSL